ncbi:MAG: HEPN domain-containing protein [Anaerolineae bacterium]
MSAADSSLSWTAKAEDDFTFLLDTLSGFAVTTRYPGVSPTADDAREAIKIAKSVRSFARSLLGVK